MAVLGKHGWFDNVEELSGVEATFPLDGATPNQINHFLVSQGLAYSGTLEPETETAGHSEDL